jgi:hypothetical protein
MPRQQEAGQGRLRKRTGASYASPAGSDFVGPSQTENTEAQMDDSEPEEDNAQDESRINDLASSLKSRRLYSDSDEEFSDGNDGVDDDNEGVGDDKEYVEDDNEYIEDDNEYVQDDNEHVSQDWVPRATRKRKPAATRKKAAESFAPDDFGISDVGSWLQENSKAWSEVPSEDDWPLIRTTGFSKLKDWNLNMSIEAAFREFKLAGTPVDVSKRRILYESRSTRLLREAISHIRNHFNSVKSGASPSENPLIRNTRTAAIKASHAYLAGQPSQEVAKLLPAHSKILACAFTSPNGSVNSTLSGCLHICNHSHLFGIGREEAAHMPVSGGMSGGLVTPMAQNAMNLALKLETEVDDFKEHQINEISSIDKTLTQVMKKMKQMNTDSSTEFSVLKAQIEELTERFSKTEGTVTDLQKKANDSISVKDFKLGAEQIEKKSIHMDHLTDEVADKLKSGSSFNSQSDLASMHITGGKLLPEAEKRRIEHTQFQRPAGSKSGGLPPSNATTPIPEVPSSKAKTKPSTAASAGPAPKRSKTIDAREKLRQRFL